MELMTRLDRVEQSLAQLADAQARTEQALAQLVALQARAEQERTAAERGLAAAQQRTEQRLEELAAAQQRTEQRLEELASSQRELVAAQQRTEQRLEELAAAQQRTEQRLEELAAAQQRTEHELAALTAAQRELTAALELTAVRLDELTTWQRGERGRREEEAYERQVVRSALLLFQGGEGGTPEHDLVQRRLRSLLAVRPDGGTLPQPQENPLLADLLWWKGDELVVVEISRVVDASDVERAYRRAQSLRQAGASARPMVVGQTWADRYTRGRAAALSVAWWVDDDVSELFIDFRWLPG